MHVMGYIQESIGMKLQAVFYISTSKRDIVISKKI